MRFRGPEALKDRKENLKKNLWKDADQTVITIQLQTARFKFGTDTLAGDRNSP
jgi:hypothetical protein